MKRLYFCFVFILILLSLTNCFYVKNFAFAQEQPKTYKEEMFKVYDEFDQLLTEKLNVMVGDVIIDKNFCQYEVYFVDEVYKTAKAKFIKQLEKPFVTRKTLSPINTIDSEKRIALYMTHNDESYIDADGTSSIYGAGGIHDIANKLASELRKKNVIVDIDETLHIPHDSNAYSRSKTTAQKLLKNNPNAIFDIHRDGVPRKNYVVYDNNGKERCKVTIVVGQANPNKEKNLQFALYLMNVAEVVCPWLFGEIYFAKGHYNQNLMSKSLLFEMGTHTIEKNLVLETVPYLANVIYTTLFGTSVDEEGNLIISNQTDKNTQTIDKVLSEKPSSPIKIVLIVLTIALSVGVASIIVYKLIKQKKLLIK